MSTVKYKNVYQVALGEVDDFEARLNNLSSSGFFPIGSMQVKFVEDNEYGKVTYFYQLMQKTEQTTTAGA